MDFIYVFSFNASRYELNLCFLMFLPHSALSNSMREDKCRYHNIFIGSYLLHRMIKMLKPKMLFVRRNRFYYHLQDYFHNHKHKTFIHISCLFGIFPDYSVGHSCQELNILIQLNRHQPTVTQQQRLIFSLLLSVFQPL